MAFLLYTHVLFLITLYATSGRNATSDASSTKDGAGAIELTPRPRTAASPSRRAWYSRLRTEESAEMHIIGNDEDEEDEEG
jgi:hypothetical protein